jgi:hypothetical protein
MRDTPRPTSQGVRHRLRILGPQAVGWTACVRRAAP